MHSATSRCSDFPKGVENNASPGQNPSIRDQLKMPSIYPVENGPSSSGDKPANEMTDRFKNISERSGLHKSTSTTRALQVGEFHENDDSRFLAERQGIPLTLMMYPFVQYAMLALVFGLYFIPYTPEIISGLQGYILTLLATGIFYLRKFGRFISSEGKSNQEDRFPHPTLKLADVLKYGPIKFDDEEVCILRPVSMFLC